MGKIENKQKDDSFKPYHINHHIKRKRFIYWIKKQGPTICFSQSVF